MHKHCWITGCLSASMRPAVTNQLVCRCKYNLGEQIKRMVKCSFLGNLLGKLTHICLTSDFDCVVFIFLAPITSLNCSF